QHATRFLEVDRPEPEPVDDRGGAAEGFDLGPDRKLVLLVVDAPGEVMDSADSPRPTRFARRLGDVEPGARAAVADRPAVPDPLTADRPEAESGGEERRRRLEYPLAHPRSVQPADLILDRHRLP